MMLQTLAFDDGSRCGPVDCTERAAKAWGTRRFSAALHHQIAEGGADAGSEEEDPAWTQAGPRSAYDLLAISGSFPINQRSNSRRQRTSGPGAAWRLIAFAMFTGVAIVCCGAGTK
jgi:hypothetical protein